ncbi:MAG: hypothetical protein HZA58_00260 [Acidimicrobiia bacterium]|nr:hypothetical protein [Acidimicrobiia bacterium]
MTRVEDRPFTSNRFHTAELPATPQRDYRIGAASWIEAPGSVLQLGDALGEPVEYKRRIGRFLLWRAGPPVGEAEYLAIDPDTGHANALHLHGKEGVGLVPDGERHTRFRTWKESLLAASGGHE